MKIITDHKWKPFKYGNEVPAGVLSSHFGHLHEDDTFDGFLCYRRQWYHVSDFMCAPEGFPAPWSGYSGDSYFSGVVIELSNDGESYRIGLYLS